MCPPLLVGLYPLRFMYALEDTSMAVYEAFSDQSYCPDSSRIWAASMSFPALIRELDMTLLLTLISWIAPSFNSASKLVLVTFQHDEWFVHYVLE